MKYAVLVLFGLTIQLSLGLPKVLATETEIQWVQIQNGVVSPVLLPHLERLLGSYSVHHNSLPVRFSGQLKIVMDGLKIHIQTAAPFDFVDASCSSRAGDLTAVQYSQTSDRVLPKAPISAWFRLDPGRCSGIDGRWIKISFNKTLFGSDNFSAEVVIRKGFRSSRGQLLEHREQSWVLTPL